MIGIAGVGINNALGAKNLGKEIDITSSLVIGILVHLSRRLKCTMFVILRFPMSVRR